ncbi:MAG: thiamine-phosphate kinase [Sulfuriflexus sp.]|nr:thiamine-phosphate kinase [Sulfuriflexus sp.]
MASGEFSLINNYFNRQSTSRDDVRLGIGDDAAVLQVASNEQLVVTTDTLVEGVHFPKNTSPFDIAYKLMAVNLSDLAAMGAEPRWASLALTLPEVNDDWLEQFSTGLFKLANKYNVQLVGGDTTRGPLTLSLTLHGVVESEKFLQRSTAQVDDAIVVSGQLGDAGLALKKLLANKEPSAELLACLNRPTPRVELGLSLVGVAHAAIDISDGLLADLGHILMASGRGAELQLKDLPISDAVKQFTLTGDWSLPLAAGDDYELCFTIPELSLAQLKTDDIALTRIGTVTKGSGIRCLTENGEQINLTGSGYEHFSDTESPKVESTS